jgi:Domain of unknown function (DUF4956)
MRLSLSALRLKGLNIVVDLQMPVQFFFRLAIHLAFLIGLVRFLYYPQNRNRDLTFSFLVFGLVIFLVMYFMIGLKVSVGFALGAFAVFGILRYRTEAMLTKDLTYLLVVVGMSVLNAILMFQPVELVVLNVLLVGFTFLGERITGLAGGRQANVQFEKLELIVPERRSELIADLEKRTGWMILGIEIGDLDFLRDTVQLRVNYQSSKNLVHGQGRAYLQNQNASD